MYIVFNISHFSRDRNDYNHRQIGQLTAALEKMCLDYNLSNMNITFTKDNNIQVEFEKPSDYTLWSLVWTRYVKDIAHMPMGTVLHMDEDY
jgi:hypothetical protein